MYGTLKKGGAFHNTLAGSVYLGESLVPNFDMFNYGSYPIIIPGKGTIHVEVYQITPTTFISLDRIEGYPGYYTRTEVSDLDGRMGWIYLAPQHKYEEIRNNYPPILSGNWTN